MAIALVQYDDYLNTGSGTTIATDTAKSVTTGNFIVVVVGNVDAGSNEGVVTGVADTAGNTYQKAVGEYKSGTTYDRNEIWYAENITGNANNIVTATFAATTSFRYISAAEFSGVATSSSLLDTSFYANPLGTSHTSGVATSTSTGDLIIGGFTANNYLNITVGSGFTTLSSDLTSVAFLAEEKILGDAGDYAATCTTGNIASIMTCAIFAVATAAPTGTNMKINIGDTFKDVSELKINIGDSWKEITSAKINIGDSWKTIF